MYFFFCYLIFLKIKIKLFLEYKSKMEPDGWAVEGAEVKCYPMKTR